MAVHRFLLLLVCLDSTKFSRCWFYHVDYAMQVYEVPLTVAKHDLVYITNDKHRSFQYLCPELSSCTFHLDILKSTAKVTYYNTLKPTPILSGPVELCQIKKKSFKLGFKDALCFQLEPMLDIAEMITDSGEEILEVDTYYMSLRNYQEMRQGKTTTVFLPLENSDGYFRLAAYVYHYRPLYGCTLMSPFSLESENRQLNSSKKVNKIEFIQKDRGVLSSGLYTVTCQGLSWSKSLVISLHLQFIAMPKIVLEGIDGYTVYLQPSSKSEKLVALFYSLHEVQAYSIEMEGFQSDAVVQIAKKSTWDISSRLEIEFFQISKDTFGRYVLTVSDDNNKQVSQRISVREKKGLAVFIAPIRRDILEGLFVLFDCFARRRQSPAVKMTWSREFEPLHEDKYSYSVTQIKKSGRSGLRLLLYDLKMNHSGLYSCSISNGIQKAAASAELIVWPFEHRYFAKFFSTNITMDFVASYTREVPYGTVGKATAIMQNEKEMVIFLFLNIAVILFSALLWIGYLIWYLLKILSREKDKAVHKAIVASSITKSSSDERKPLMKNDGSATKTETESGTKSRTESGTSETDSRTESSSET